MFPSASLRAGGRGPKQKASAGAALRAGTAVAAVLRAAALRAGLEDKVSRAAAAAVERAAAGAALRARVAAVFRAGLAGLRQRPAAGAALRARAAVAAVSRAALGARAAPAAGTALRLRLRLWLRLRRVRAVVAAPWLRLGRRSGACQELPQSQRARWTPRPGLV